MGRPCTKSEVKRLTISLVFLWTIQASAQAPLTAMSTLRFTPAAWALVSAASDSASTAWCAPTWRFVGDTVDVGDLQPTSQAFDPPCGARAIVLKRPYCAFHYLESVHWWIEPPRAIIAICKENGRPHFVALSWPVAHGIPMRISAP